jgi:hypothetical protein
MTRRIRSGWARELRTSLVALAWFLAVGTLIWFFFGQSETSDSPPDTMRDVVVELDGGHADETAVPA